jgi:Cys-tRNA(Pro)/Cys-tRNA(Cys) deacylase
MKTNAVRQLEREGIPFELREYEVDEEHLEAERVAEQLGLETPSVFKTIITLGDRTGPLFALTPAGFHLDPRLLAEASHNKRIEVAPLRSVLELTGYVRGSVTPLAAKRPFPVFIDETVVLWPRVSISGGRRGLQILIAPDDLIRVTSATLSDFARPD